MKPFRVSGVSFMRHPRNLPPSSSSKLQDLLFGFACANGAWGRRIATVIFAFAGMFWFAGRPENAYWGFLYTPLMPLGWSSRFAPPLKASAKLRSWSVSADPRSAIDGILLP